MFRLILTAVALSRLKLRETSNTDSSMMHCRLMSSRDKKEQQHVFPAFYSSHSPSGLKQTRLLSCDANTPEASESQIHSSIIHIGTSVAIERDPAQTLLDWIKFGNSHPRLGLCWVPWQPLVHMPLRRPWRETVWLFKRLATLSVCVFVCLFFMGLLDQ